MYVFDGVCRPLEQAANMPDAHNHALHKLQFWNSKVVHDCFSWIKAQVKDGLLVMVKLVQCCPNPISCPWSNGWSLRQVPELHEHTDCSDDIQGSSASNDNDEISLHISLCSPAHLFELCDPISEVAKSCNFQENWEVKVDFLITKHNPAPFDIMIPTLTVPIVQGLRCKEVRRCCKQPIYPEGELWCHWDETFHMHQETPQCVQWDAQWTWAGVLSGQQCRMDVWMGPQSFHARL